MSLRNLSTALVLMLTCSSAPVFGAPDYNGEILFDRYGVPHIYGADEASMFYGFGYATVKNHGDLVLKLYGQARGRAAEYWGAGEAESDRWVIANGIYDRAASWYKRQPRRFRSNLDAFAAGMTAYGRAHPDKLDPAMRQVLPITGVDVMAHAHRLMNYIYVAPQARTLNANDEAGSNAWAVMPRKSASGNTMLLANPHLPWAPSYYTYMEVDLNSPGFHAYGATQVGLPVLRFMFNDRMGFTNTVNGVLGATNYELKTVPGGYLFDGKVRPFSSVAKTYKVLQTDGSLKPETFEVQSSVHGPAFTRRDGKIVALRVAGLDRPGALLQYWDMSKAANFAEYQAVMKRVQVPSFNIIYADKEGHVQYLYNGILPKHREGDLRFWSGLVPGDTSNTLWKGVHPYDDLPKVSDPASGYVQNTNDPPWLSTYPAKLRYEDYPPYMANNGPLSLRAQHSNHLLANAEKISFEDFQARKLNTRALLADRVLDDLITAALRDPDPAVQEAAALLAAWNRRYDGDARAALLFETFARKFAGPTFQSETNFKIPWSEEAPISTPSGIMDQGQAVAMLKAAIGETIKLYGRIDRPFGEVSRFSLGGAVSVPGNGGFGNLGVFRVISWGAMQNGTRVPVHGETWVAMVEFSTPIKAVGLMSYGSSTQPGTQHRSDQLNFMAEKTFRTLWYTRAEVEANVEERVGF